MSRPDAHAAAGASTLLDVLHNADDAGFTEQFIAQEDGTVRCRACGHAVPATRLRVRRQYRLEGATDAADEMLVMWVRCSDCDARGTLTLGYGPNASDADVAVTTALHEESDSSRNAG